MAIKWLCFFSLMQLSFFSLVSGAATSTEDSVSVAGVVADFQKSKTVAQALDKLASGGLKAEADAMRPMLKGHEQDALPAVARLSENRYRVETKSLLVPFTVVAAEQGKFLVNNKPVEIKLGAESVEENWRSISAALPSTKSSAFRFLLPEANADGSALDSHPGMSGLYQYILPDFALLYLGTGITHTAVCSRDKSLITACKYDVVRLKTIQGDAKSMTSWNDKRTSEETDRLSIGYAGLEDALHRKAGNCSADSANELTKCADEYADLGKMMFHWDVREGKTYKETYPNGAPAMTE